MEEVEVRFNSFFMFLCSFASLNAEKTDQMSVLLQVELFMKLSIGL